MLLINSQIRSKIILEAGEAQQQLVTFCTVFMGYDRLYLLQFILCYSYPQLLTNPHLRAKLAQLISLMISTDKENHQGLLQTAVRRIHEQITMMLFSFSMQMTSDIFLRLIQLPLTICFHHC